MEDTAFPSDNRSPHRSSFQMPAQAAAPPLEDAKLMSTLVTAADSAAIKEAIPDEPFLSVETKTIIAALLAEFLGTLFLILISVGIQVSCFVLPCYQPHNCMFEAKNVQRIKTCAARPMLAVSFHLFLFGPLATEIWTQTKKKSTVSFLKKRGDHAWHGSLPLPCAGCAEGSMCFEATSLAFLLMQPIRAARSPSMLHASRIDTLQRRTTFSFVGVSATYHSGNRCD